MPNVTEYQEAILSIIYGNLHLIYPILDLIVLLQIHICSYNILFAKSVHILLGDFRRKFNKLAPFRGENLTSLCLKKIKLFKQNLTSLVSILSQWSWERLAIYLIQAKSVYFDFCCSLVDLFSWFLACYFIFF